MERICYMNPALGAPYYDPMRRTPMEEAYRYALRTLEDAFEHEMRTLYELSAPYNLNTYNDYYRREHEIKSYYYSRRERLESDFTRNVQQYYYGYANSSYRSFNDSWYTIQQSQLDILKLQMNPPIYFNSKETIKVPTETKKFIIFDSDRAAYFAEAKENDPYPPFDTLAEAEKEAQGLARENPTEEFTIYQTVKKYKVAGTPLDTTVFV